MKKKPPKKSVKRRTAAKKHTGTNKVTAPSLTIRQKRLCDIYHSMKKPYMGVAYERAGYKARGSTAQTEAQREMKKPHVKAYLDSLKKASTARAERTADEIIAELEKVGFSNISDYLTFGPTCGVRLKLSGNLTKSQLAAIESISETKTQHGGTIRFKLHDKPESLHLLGKRYGLFPTREVISPDQGELKPFKVVLTDD